MKGSKGRNCNVYREVALTTGNVSEYVVIDNNILDVLNLQDDDKLPLNSLHILEECNIPTIRCSQDKHKIDKYGNRLLDLCRSSL